MEKKLSISIFEDGILFRSHNRRVAVINRSEKGIKLQFVRTSTKEILNIPTATITIIKGKVIVTEILLSEESAKGLHACLRIYFEKKNIK